MSDPSSKYQPVGINVIGRITANLGLGVLARAVVRLLAQNAVPVAAFDIDAGFGRSGADLSLSEYLVPAPSDLPHPINLFVLPAPSLQTVLPPAGGPSAWRGSRQRSPSHVGTANHSLALA